MYGACCPRLNAQSYAHPLAHAHPRFPGHPESVDALAVFDDDTLITGSFDGVVRVGRGCGWECGCGCGRERGCVGGACFLGEGVELAHGAALCLFILINDSSPSR